MWYTGWDGLTNRIGYATSSYIDADFLSIQNAIEFADPGDTILVHPGKYNEKLLINKSLTLQSTDGWQNTMIDPAMDSIVRIQGPVEVTVQGFDITGGSWGIHVGSAEKKVNILDCFIQGNTADGIYVVGGGTLLNIERNIISANGNPGGGCGIYIEQAWSTVNILYNEIGVWWDGEPEDGTIYAGNNGDGMRIDNVPAGTDVTIWRNNIAENGDDGIDFPSVFSVHGSVNIQENIIGAWVYYYEDAGSTRFDGNHGDGIHVAQVGDTGSINIEGNKISENARVEEDTGIFILGIYGAVTVADNDIGAWEDEHGEPYLGNEGQGIFVSAVFSGGD